VWPEILTAVALLLVLEGIFPFISPEQYKRTMSQILKLPEHNLRALGLAVMVLGVVLLYWVNR